MTDSSGPGDNRPPGHPPPSPPPPNPSFAGHLPPPVMPLRKAFPEFDRCTGKSVNDGVPARCGSPDPHGLHR